MLTAAVRDLHAAAPGQFQTDVRTSCPGLVGEQPAPHAAARGRGGRGSDRHALPADPPEQPAALPFHPRLSVQYLEERLGVRIPVTAVPGGHPPVRRGKASSVPGWRGRAYRSASGSWWPAGKRDFTAKWWDPARFQTVVDHFRGRIAFVQCGEAGHWHPPLEGVINLRRQDRPAPVRAADAPRRRRPLPRHLRHAPRRRRRGEARAGPRTGPAWSSPAAASRPTGRPIRTTSSSARAECSPAAPTAAAGGRAASSSATATRRTAATSAKAGPDYPPTAYRRRACT